MADMLCTFYVVVHSGLLKSSEVGQKYSDFTHILEAGDLFHALACKIYIIILYANVYRMAYEFFGGNHLIIMHTTLCVALNV